MARFPAETSLEVILSLSDFIQENQEQIIEEWEAFARTLIPATAGLDKSALRDHSKEILAAICDDMSRTQTSGEQSLKSRGRGTQNRMSGVGKIHADLRIERGMKIDELIAEYRALRASVLRMCEKNGRIANLEELTRFNEAIDEAMIEAAIRFVELMDQTRERFVGVLGHDLRTPLSAIVMSARSLELAEASAERVHRSAERIFRSASRMQRMIDDLLDLARTTLGSGIPIKKARLDLAALCREVLSELEALHPSQNIRLETQGALIGEWDGDRLAQVLSNLVANAIRHGSEEAPITVVARGDGEDVVVEVHNEGPPIPPHMLEKIFEPMVRYSEDGSYSDSGSLGLGLFISREIVGAHGGTQSVSSTEDVGTTFTFRLPRHSVANNHDADASQAKPTS